MGGTVPITLGNSRIYRLGKVRVATYTNKYRGYTVAPFTLMESQQERHTNKSWLYRLLVITLIPCLFVYYTFLQPIGHYLKGLIAEQNGNLYQRPTTPMVPSVRKTFIMNAAPTIAVTLHKYISRYWWLLTALVLTWLVLVIGIVPTIECIACWFGIWLMLMTLRMFLRGINR
jgi:hypothetical protein